MLRCPLFVLCLAILICSAGAQRKYNFTGAAAKWYDFGKLVQSFISKLTRQMFQPILRTVQMANISTDCTMDLLRMYSGFQKLDTDAVKMVDANGMAPKGFGDGAITAFGGFDQCLRVKAKKGDKILYRGRYCLIHLMPFLPPKPDSLIAYPVRTPLEEFKQLQVLGNHAVVEATAAAQVFYIKPFRIGTCLPSSCSRDDLYRVVKEATRDYFSEASIPVCYDEMTPTTWTTAQIVIGSILFAYFIFILAASIFELYCIRKGAQTNSHQGLNWSSDDKFQSTSGKYTPKENVWMTSESSSNGQVTATMPNNRTSLNEKAESSGRLKAILINFSAISNSRKIFQAVSKEKEMCFVHGLRLIAIIWVIAGHTYILSIFSVPLRGVRNYSHMIKSPFFNIIQNATVSVDIFFFLSGFFLVFYAVKSPKGYNVFQAIIKRYFRIAPAYGIVIALTMLFPLLGTGPNWNDASQFLMGTCHEDWWKKMLFIENFFGEVEFHSDCLMHGWYLAVDFQLFVLGTFLLYMIIKFPKYGIVTTIAVILASCSAVAVVTVHRGYYPTLYSLSIDTEFLNYVYFWAYSHAGPFYVGALVGNFCGKNSTLELNRKKKIAFWALSVLFLFISFFPSYFWNNNMIARTSPLTAVYASLHRTVWGIGLAIAFILMFYNHGGLVSRFLGMKAFIPLSRLSYGAYLVHLSVQAYFAGSVKIEVHYDHITMMQFLVCNTATTFVVSFLLNIFLVGPLFGLDRYLTSRERKREQAKELDDQTSPKNNSSVILIKTRI